MGTLKQEILYFNDAAGKILPNSTIETYDSVATTTQKPTYTDEDLEFTNAWPVVSDGRGVFPPIYLKASGYRIVVKDKDGVVQFDRGNINVADTTILSTSDFYFNDLTELKLGASINGTTVNLTVGQIARTVGNLTTTDGAGAEWLVVAAGTGTADDDLFVNLDNGLQAQRLFNQVYGSATDFLQVANNLSDVSDADASRIALNAQESPALVTNYYSTTSTYRLDQIQDPATISFTVDNVGSGSFYQVGPTGSGGVEWSELDALPLTAQTLHVLIKLNAITFTTPADGGFLSVSAKLIAATGGGTIDYMLAEIAGVPSAGFGKLALQAPVYIPLDSSNSFQVKWERDANITVQSIQFQIKGFEV